MTEEVVKPSHYTKPSGQVWDVLDEWFPTDPLLWQAGKYLARWNAKGNPVDNLEKAMQYIQRRLDYLKADECRKPTVQTCISLGLDYPPHDAWEGFKK